MRESAAQMAGDLAQAGQQVGTGEPGRLITADSFRLLIAKLGPRPASVHANGHAAEPPPTSLRIDEPDPAPSAAPADEEPVAMQDWPVDAQPEPVQPDISEPEPFVEERAETLSAAEFDNPFEPQPESVAAPISEPAEIAASVDSDWSSFVAPPVTDTFTAEPPAPEPENLTAAIHSAESWEYWLESEEPPAPPAPVEEPVLEAAEPKLAEANPIADEIPPDEFPVDAAEAVAEVDLEPEAEPEPVVEPVAEVETEPLATTDLPPDEFDSMEAPGGEEAPMPVFTIDLNAEPQSPDLQWPELVGSLSERLGSGATLLKRVDVEADPFAQPSQSAQSRRLSSFDIADPDQGSEQVARSLLAIMSAPFGASQPQERALAADTLLRLAPRLPIRALIAVAERVSVMECPPPLLIGLLLRDTRDEVAGPLLERASMVSDQDLFSVIAEGDVTKQRMIARRRIISPALADALVMTGELAVLLTLVRNPGAALSQDTFARLCVLAREHPALQAPLATRADTPAPIAFELFWAAPPELRRFVLSRFLTDSETLDKILKITLAVDGETLIPSEAKLPPKLKVDELIALIEQGAEEQSIALLCELANICEANARRILDDRQGEPLTVMFKALGLPRGRLVEVLERLRVSVSPRLDPERSPGDLQTIFDTLSFNKTRVLLTYWDWAAQTTGPYAHLAA